MPTRRNQCRRKRANRVGSSHHSMSSDFGSRLCDFRSRPSWPMHPERLPKSQSRLRKSLHSFHVEELRGIQQHVTEVRPGNLSNASRLDRDVADLLEIEPVAGAVLEDARLRLELPVADRVLVRAVA